MFNLITLLGWSYVRKRPLRWILTASGIALGVGVVVAMLTANVTVLNSFSQTVDRIAGNADLQIVAGETGLSETILDTVQARPEVSAAAPVIEEYVNINIRGQTSLLILGVDMLGDPSFRKYDIEGADDEVIDDLLVFLAQTDSLIITSDFARQNDLRVNSRISLPTAEGSKQFTVRGIIRSGSLAGAFGGNLAIMDIYAAQKMFGRGHFFDHIDLIVKPGVSVKSFQADLAKTLGPGFQVEVPTARSQEFEPLLGVYSRMNDLLSSFALLIGAFIVYNSFATAVNERRSEIGILRALGATRKQVRLLFLLESVAVGLVSSAIGVVFGLALAWGAIDYISNMLEALYGVAFATKQVVVSRSIVVSAFVLGTLASIIGAALPAQGAAQTNPIQALQRGKYQSVSTRDRWGRWVAAIIGLVASGIWFWRATVLFVYIGYLLSLLAVILLAPTLVAWFLKLLRKPVHWLLPVEGVLAADGLMQALRRTSTTVTALMLSLAIAIAMGGVSRAAYSSVRQWLLTTFNADLLITTSKNLASHSFLFPASMDAEMKDIPGIADVQGARMTRLTVGERSATLIATDVRKLFEHIRPEVTEGDPNEMSRLTGEGKGVIISENFATLQNVHLNDVVEIPTPRGVLRLPVVGVFKDYTSQQGTWLIDRSVWERYWDSPEVNVFRVYLQPSVGTDEVRRRILEKFGGQRQLFVFTKAELAGFTLGIFDRWFDLTYLQILVAVVVAMLGIANTLFVSISDRRRELSVLRAVGALSSQIRAIIIFEALLIAFVGLVMGIAFGAGNLLYTLEIGRRSVSGITLPYEFPWKVVGLLPVAVLVAAWISAAWPAQLAVRSRLVEGLEYE